jgi:hypothetical protein
MEWLTGLTLLPALVCGVMMGGTALAGVVGWRSWQVASTDTDAKAFRDAGTDGAVTEPRDASKTLGDARR